MQEKLAAIAGSLLILLGTGFLFYLGYVWYSLYQIARGIGAQFGPMTPEAWAYVLGGVIVVTVGAFLIFQAQRRK
jgi:hypothetical protein